MITPGPTCPTRTAPMEMTVTELDCAGLLRADPGARISRFAVFVPADGLGTPRPIIIHCGAVIGPFAVIHGGTTIGAQARIGEHTVVGLPEPGHPGRCVCPGTGGGTVISTGAIVHAGAVVYADVRIGANSVVGHRTVLRTGVRIDSTARLGHHVTVEHASRIGHAKVGSGSVVPAGVTLGEGAVIGACSLVTRESRRMR